MDEQNNSNFEDYEIKEGDLLNIANNILSLLNYSQKLEDEEDLFLDDFYVSIIGNLLSDIQPEITPGNTIQEKAQIMDKLVLSLSQAIEMDLPHINGSAIILNHDKSSAKNLLDVISELFKTIIDNNLEEVDEEKNEENDKNISSSKKKEKNQKENIEDYSKNELLNKNIEDYQISENNEEKNEYKISENNKNNIDILDNEENMKQSQDSFLKINSSCFEPLQFQKMMEQIKDKENKVKHSYMRQTYSQNDISRYERNREDAERNREDIETENENNLLGEKVNKNNKVENNEQIINDKEESPIMNISNINDVNKEKDGNYSGKKSINNKKSNTKEKKKDETISDLKDSNEIKNKSSGKKKYIKDQNNHNNIFDNEEENMDSKFLDNQESEIDLNYSENKTAQSMPPAYINLHLEESEEKENLENKDVEERKKTESIFDDSHIIKGSQMDNSNRFNEEEELEPKEIEYNNNSTSSKKNKSPSNKINSNTKSNKKEETNSKQSSKIKNKNILKNSSLEEKNSIHSQKKTSEKKINSNQQNNQMQINPEKENSQKSQNKTQSENKLSESNNIPLNDQSFKYQIMKEFRKLYGDKLDFLFSKYNSQFSPNLIESALRNIKLAKNNMLKVGNRFPPKDDPKTLEYLQKYQKELELMLINYTKEQKKQEILNGKKMNIFSKRVKDKQKMEEIERIKTENEIERRQKAKEIRNYHSRIKFGNNVYKKALDMEKQKNIEKMKYEKEIIEKENEEKRKAMITIEKYYKDQIKMLKEILAREKRERDIEHREYMIYLNKKEREMKEEYKKQLYEIFQKFDEEERIEEYENDNNPEIKRIFDAYYGS